MQTGDAVFQRREGGEQAHERMASGDLKGGHQVADHHLAEAGVEPSVGRVGDSYDSVMTETAISLHKTEVTRRPALVEP